MRAKERFGLVGRVLLAGALAGCGAAPAAMAPAPTPPAAAAPDGRVLTATVQESNLLIPDEPLAKDYLRKKLLQALTEQLVPLGFDAASAARLAAAGQVEEFSVRPHKEQVFGTGVEEGKVRFVTLWDVAGKLSLRLSDEQVAELGRALDALPRTSLDEIEAVETYLERFRSLRPEADQLAGLDKAVGDRLAEALSGFLKVQLATPASPEDEFEQALVRVARPLRNFRKRHPGHAAFGELENAFRVGALKRLRAVPLEPKNIPALRALFLRFAEMCGDELAESYQYLRRTLELDWRNRIQRQDEGGVPFPELRQDFLLFMQEFPGSDFYPELELRFLSRWVDFLLALRPADVEALNDQVDQVNLLGERFPRCARLAEIRAALGQRCVELFSNLAIPDLERLRRVQDTLARCDPFMGAGLETMAMRERIARITENLERARDDRAEREALKDLTFFIGWDARIAKLSWGKPRAEFPGQAEFAAAWAQGADAGSECHCSLDPEEPCRAFESEGSHGGFEVVARFYRERLLGVDLCQVFTGPDLSAIYGFFARRYPKAHTKAQAAAFLAGGGAVREVAFGQGPGLRVILARGADTCSVRYRDGGLLKQQEQDELAEKKRKEEEARRAREERVRRGWQPGECVQWDCEASCAFRGTVRKREERRYLVVITAAEEEGRQVGTAVWVRAQELYDCPE